MPTKSIISVAALAAVTGLAVSTASAQITIPTVSIGNPGNAPDPATGNLYGSVAYAYNIGTTEVTNAQYAAFLNAKAASDPFNLYNTNMAGSTGGITRSGSAGSYTYATVSGRENNPVNFVSFWDATRFANWLHNGQGSGDTENGAYTLGGVTNPMNSSVTRNAGWQWAVTSEDEWYKAAYHQPASAGGDSDNYWLYPTQSNTVPTTAQANFFGNGINNTTPVGSYAANYYGTFDMGGNVWEWNEDITSGSNRGILGGSFNDGSNYLRANSRILSVPTNEFTMGGFRVSQVRITRPITYCTPGTTSSDCLAAMGYAGAPSASAASGFELQVTNVEPNKQGLIFYGVSGRAISPWAPNSTSYLCVKSPTQRMSLLNSNGNAGLCNGTLSIDWLAWLAANPGALGAPFSSGVAVNAQAWFRDPPAAKTTNLSNALEFVTVP